jgi:hypothetical protein
MEKRLFSVQEANELIPFLSERLPRLRALRQNLAKMAPSKTPSTQDLVLMGGIAVDGDYFRRVKQLQQWVSEIGSKGCQIKDLDSLLVDFPTLLEGREVYLCWKMGESEVGFWHEVDAGFAGRQPLKAAL